MIKDPQHDPDMADPQLRPRYTNIAALFQTQVAETLDNVDISVVGIPFDEIQP